MHTVVFPLGLDRNIDPENTISTFSHYKRLPFMVLIMEVPE